MWDKYEKLKLERYQRFVYTLNQCGKFVIELSDESIETCIFEDLDIGIRSDISDENIELFLDEGWIDEDIKERCLRMKRMFLDIQVNQPGIWNVQSVKTSIYWYKIMELSDEIKSLLYF